MSKAIRNLEAEIAVMIAKNRSNCDSICHALVENGLDEELDVGPLRTNLESAALGQGYAEFLRSADGLMECEPALDKTKINPMILEAWNFVYDTAKMKVKLVKLRLENLPDKPEKEKVSELETLLGEEQGRVAVALLGFTKFRAQTHVDLGNYKPAKNVDEVKEGKAGANYKTFLVQKGKQVMDGMKAGPGDVWEAVKAKDTARVQQLMENGFNPNEYDLTTGGIPLHQAAWDGEIEICKLLLEAKAAANLQTLRGFSPMHFAMQHGHLEITELLKQHGANMKTRSAMGQRPGGQGDGLGSEFEIKTPFY